jgi:hypothetical protein
VASTSTPSSRTFFLPPLATARYDVQFDTEDLR